MMPELKNSSKFKIEAKENVFLLTVNKSDHPDVGAYKAQVDNGIDHTEQTAPIESRRYSCTISKSSSDHNAFCYLVKPKVEAPKPANEQSSVIGQDTQIAWKFSGIEKPQVTWLFNGQPLSTNDRYQITDAEDGTSTLSIKHAELSR